MKSLSLVTAAAGLLSADAVALSRSDAGADAKLPITNVVKLLEEMQKDLEAEARADEKTWEKLECWCDKNKGEKTKAVEDAKSRIDELQTTIETTAGKVSTLKVKIENANKDIDEGERALAEASEMRLKEAAAFHDQERDLMTSVNLLKGAITALSKHHPALVQSDEGYGMEIARMRPALRSMVHKNLKILGFLRTSPHKDDFVAFLDAHADILDADGEDALLQAESFLQKKRSSLPFKGYAPQSGQVMGVLKQMKDAFEEDIPEIQKDEQSKLKAYSEMKGAKESELEELRNAVEAHTQEYAANKEANGDAKYDMKDTKAAMDADQRFMLELIEKCTNAEHAYPKRAKLRQDEISAVSQAIAILDTDAVRDGQQTTFGFLQLNSQMQSKIFMARRAQAMAFLQKAVHQAPALALLLQGVGSDPFEKVIAAIDKLAKNLDIQQADEVKQRDFCIEEFHQNEVQKTRKTAESEGLAAKIEDLGATSKALGETLDTLKTEVKDLQTELQRATNARKEENMEYQRVVGDQRVARQALEAAYAKLQEFYAKKQSLLQADAQIPNAQHYENQAREAAGSAPEFSDHTPNKKSGSVLTLIKKIAGDTRVLEEESVHNEQTSQSSYEALIKETNDSVKAKTRLITDKTEEKASIDQAKADAESEKESVDQTLQDLADSLVAIHGQCDYLMRNFDARQEARSAEADALAEVKAILSGMKGSA
jgi:chromosome segregation ATPase